MSRRASVPVLAVLVLVALSLWIARSRRPAPALRPPPPVARTEPTSVVKGLEFVDMDPDGTRCRILAQEGSGWEQEGTGNLVLVDAILQKQGKDVRVRAGRAAMEEGRLLKLSAGVKVTWDDYEAVLDRAEYHRGKGRISSDAPVVLKGPGMSVCGTGVDVDLTTRGARIRSGVRAVLVGGAR